MMRRFSKIPVRLGTLLSVPIIAAWATVAQAQEAEPEQSRNHIEIGAGVAVQPTYQGSSEYRVLPIPAIDIQHGWFFANLRNGIGIEPINTEHLTIGASVVFVQGYRRQDVPVGIDKLSDGVGARLSANVRAGGFITTFGATQVVSGGTEGFIADGSISYPIPISDRFTLIPTVGTTWANAKYNDRYFGVSAAESTASGLPQFTVGSGFKDVSGTLTASYRLTDHITINATGGVTALIDDFADSPIVAEETQPFGLLTVSYRF
jgi:outer membrane protein